jgi:hypothetical protein
MREPNSLTGAYISGKQQIEMRPSGGRRMAQR